MTSFKYRDLEFRCLLHEKSWIIIFSRYKGFGSILQADTNWYTAFDKNDTINYLKSICSDLAFTILEKKYKTDLEVKEALLLLHAELKIVTIRVSPSSDSLNERLYFNANDPIGFIPSEELIKEFEKMPKLILDTERSEAVANLIEYNTSSPFYGRLDSDHNKYPKVLFSFEMFENWEYNKSSQYRVYAYSNGYPTCFPADSLTDVFEILSNSVNEYVAFINNKI